MLITPGLDAIVSTPPGTLGNGIDDFLGAVLLEGKCDWLLPIGRDFGGEATCSEAPVPIFVQGPTVTFDWLWILSLDGLWILNSPAGDTSRLGLRILNSLGLTTARSFRRVSSRNQG